MTVQAAISPLVGMPWAGNIDAAVEVADAASGYVPKIALGTIISVVDPYWGGLELIRLKIPISTAAILVGTVATWDNAFGFVICPNTANLGTSVAVSQSAIPLNATYIQYAWFVIGGTFPVLSGASVAADTALGITAAGIAGAIGAGKQLCNMRVRVAATTTVVKANTVTRSGSPVLRVTNSDGWFTGIRLTGTGIAATTDISGISQNGKSVTMENNATASGAVSITGTYNDGASFWNVCTMNRPFAQGAIT